MYSTGEIIKILRKKNKLTQVELAEILKVKLSSIQKYESNAVSLKMSTLRTLCEEFDLPPYIFVFPDKLKNIDILTHTNNNMTISYGLSFNKEGLTKVSAYIEDLHATGKYTNNKEF
jgi:transcriptional regulator with XRE-family HTH domain